MVPLFLFPTKMITDATIKQFQESVAAVAKAVDDAETAFAAAGVPNVGSLAERIRQLTAERDNYRDMVYSPDGNGW